MVSMDDKQTMEDDLVAILEKSYNFVDPRNEFITNDVVHKIHNIWIQDYDTGKYGVLLLVDKKFTAEEFRNIYSFIDKKASDSETKKDIFGFSVVFYKDGDKFFRAAAPGSYYKDTSGKSTIKLPLQGINPLEGRKYDSTDINKMILFGVEEGIVFESCKKIALTSDKKEIPDLAISDIQYYHPDQGLITYTFANVIADYSKSKDRLSTIYLGPNSSQKFIPKTNPEYKRRHIIIDEKSYPAALYPKLVLEKSLLTGNSIEQSLYFPKG